MTATPRLAIYIVANNSGGWKYWAREIMLEQPWLPNCSGNSSLQNKQGRRHKVTMLAMEEIRLLLNAATVGNPRVYSASIKEVNLPRLLGVRTMCRNK